ncbi:poly ADP-ribose polymerase [Mactra antiquata]
MASQQKSGGPGPSHQNNRNQRNDRQGNARTQNQRGQSRPNNAETGRGQGSDRREQRGPLMSPPLYSQPPPMFHPSSAPPNMSYAPHMQQPVVIHTTVISPQYGPGSSHPMQGPGYYQGPPPPYSPGPGVNAYPRKNDDMTHDYGRTYEENNRGRGRQQNSNRGRGSHSNTNRMERADSCTSVNSVGTNDNHGNKSGRGRQNNQQHGNRGRGSHSNTSRMERADSCTSVNSVGTDDNHGNKSGRGRGRQNNQQHGNRGRGSHSNTSRMERADSCTSVNSVGTNDNHGNKSGRGRQNNQQHGNRGRGSHSNTSRMERADSCTSLNSVGTDDNHGNKSGRGRQNNQQHGNRRRGSHSNTNRMERADSCTSVNSVGTDDNHGNKRGRGRQNNQQHGNRGRGSHSNTNRMERADSCTSVNSVGTDDNHGNKRGRGRQNNQQHGNRGRGSHSNTSRMERADSCTSLNSVGRNDGKHANEGKKHGRGQDRRDQSNRGRAGHIASDMGRAESFVSNTDGTGCKEDSEGRNHGKGQDRRNQTNRGRGRRGNFSNRDGANNSTSLNKGIENSQYKGNNHRGRGQVRRNFPRRGMGRGSHSYIDMASQRLSQLFHERNLPCRGMGRDNNGSHSSVELASQRLSQIFHDRRNFFGRGQSNQSIRRGRLGRMWRPGRYQRGYLGCRNTTMTEERNRTTSMTGSGEYTDCTESVISCSDDENEEDQTVPDSSSSLLNTVKWVQQTFSHGRYMHAGKRRGIHRKPGKWSSLSKKINDNQDEFDDSESVVSEFSTVGEESEETAKFVKQQNEKDEIKLDDLFTISLKTLTNRITRYKKNVSNMKKRKEDPNLIKVYESRLMLVLEAKAKRIKDRDHESGESRQNKVPSDESETTVTEGSVSDDSESKTQKKTRNVQKSHATKSVAKGSISFAPKRNKKMNKSNTNKKQENATKDENYDSDDSLDKRDEVRGANRGSKEHNSKKKNVKVMKPETAAVSDEEEEEDADGTGLEDKQGAKKKRKPRKRNRNKKVTTDENDIHETVEKNDTSDKANINDILNQLDDLLLNERKEKVRPCTEWTPEVVHEENTGISFDDRHDIGNARSKTQKNDRKEVKKVRETTEKHHDNEVIGPDVNEVFKFLVKNLEGKGTPEEIVRESGLFPLDCNSSRWFRRWRGRFNLIEKNNVIQLVLVLNKDASYCLDYIRNKSCKKSGCSRYHVCKDMLSGHCIYGAGRCKYSHDFLDERNVQVSKTLGFNNVFTNDEIRSILRVRFPHVCSIWVDNGACNLDGCCDLHICPRFICGNCLEGDDCVLCHDKNSEHNLPIMKAFNMTAWNDSLWKKMIYVVRKAVNAENDGGPLEGEQPGNRENNVIQEVIQRHTSISEESEDAGSSYICIDHLEEKCNVENCLYVHSKMKLPYVWQICLFSESWVTMEDSECIEQSYCNKKDYSDMIQMGHDGLEMGVRIHFKPYIRGVVNIAIPKREEMSVEARRLSTLSYKENDGQNDVNCGTGDFCTQWRWYWRDDDYIWQMFEPDAMQETLESKFLAKQDEYNYSRENYKFIYTISFNAMKQTNLEYRTVRNIVRRPLFVSSNDVMEKCFPQSLPMSPVIKVSLPDSWVPWDLVYPFELVRLNENDRSYQLVCENFYKTLDRNNQQVSDIFRVQNHKLWMLFKNQEDLMQSNYQRVGKNTSVDKRYLFHGTQTLDAVRGISINNFDIRVSGAHGTLYGDGAYFATTAKYSHNYTSPPKRFMFLVNVLVGQYTKGHKSYRRPPDIPGSQHELYDSCVDDEIDPKIFVVSDKNQFYPEYLIQYTDVRDGDTDLNQPAPRPTVRRSAVPGTSTTGRQSAAPGTSTTVRPGTVSTATNVLYQQSDVSLSGHSNIGTPLVSRQAPSSSSSDLNFRQQNPRQAVSPTTSPKKKDEGCNIQ